MAEKTDRSKRESGSSSYWAKLSDDELLATEFYTDDPEKLEGLLDTPPEGDEIPGIEFAYDTKQTGTGMVRCIHCKKTAKNHNKGFVLQFENGDRMLFGKDCGEKQYGVVFNQVKQSFYSASARKEALEHRLSVLSNKPTIVDLLERVEGAECWQQFADLKKQFNRAMRELSPQFAESASRHDGALYLAQSVRDHDEEAKFEERTGRAVPIYKNVQSIHWQLRGKRFFEIEPLPSKLVAPLVHRAKGALLKLGEEAGSTHEMKQFFRGMDRILGDLRDQANRVDDLPKIFTREQVEALSAWLHANSYGTLRFSEYGVYRSNRRGEVRQHFDSVRGEHVREEIILPNPFATPPHDLLDEIEHLLADPATRPRA